MNRLSKLIIIAVGASCINASAVVTIGHTENATTGEFRLSDGTLPTAGGVSIGFFSSGAPSDAALQALSSNVGTAYTQLLALGWVDVRNLSGTTSPAAGAWDFPTIGGTASNVTTGGTYALNTQLYVVAFNAGAYVAGTQGNMASTSTSFAGSTEWAVIKDTAYKNAADPGGVALLLSSATGAGEVIVGTEGAIGDGANDIRMFGAVPEPSRALLGMIGLVALFVRRRR